MVQFCQTLIYFATLADIVNDVLVEYVHLPHLLVDLRQVLDVLSGVLDHAGSEGSLLPELRVILHQVINLVLFGVVLAQVLLEQVIEADVDVAVVVLLQEVGDEAVRDLRVEHEVADQVVLADHGRGVFAEIVEYLHDHIGLHDLLEPVAERIHCLQVDDEALVREEHLDELHAPIFSEALAIHAQDGRALLLHDVHDGLRELGHFPRRRDHIRVFAKLLLLRLLLLLGCLRFQELLRVGAFLGLVRLLVAVELLLRFCGPGTLRALSLLQIRISLLIRLSSEDILHCFHRFNFL